MLVVKFLEKGSILGYPMIITKVFESEFELSNANIKLKILNDWSNEQEVGFMVSSDVENNLAFIVSE